MALAPPPLNPKNRTVIDFVATDPWPRIEAWAKKHDFKVRKQEPDLRLYRRGGWVTTPVFAQFSQDGDRMRLHAWIVPDGMIGGNGFVEIDITTRDLHVPLVRSSARKAIKVLLDDLGVPFDE